MDGLKFGYFSSLKIGESYIGGIMITDAASIPLEFKYTDIIKPTKIHRIVFGKVIEKYINEEVIRKTLFREVKTIPSIYFVNDGTLLSDSAVNKIPQVLLQSTNLQKQDSIEDFQKIRDKEFLIQPKTSSKPLKLIFHTQDPQIQEEVFKKIKIVINKIDLFEPFLRVEEALKTICQQKN
jgi:hypothetical protein